MKVSAPGKLILSGEHAVVYGNPALAMAINRYATATITKERLPRILFDLADIAHHSHINIDALRKIKDRVKRKYYRFICGEYTIRHVLNKPFELAQFALGLFAESLNISLPHGVKIHVQSDIPIGCGMGSSAATILSVMHAISTYLQVQISPETLYQLALEAENMQHGHSSGFDLRVAQHGGCIYMHNKQIESRTAPQMPMYLINTGTPLSTTGQCVEKVAPHFKSNHLSDDFAAVTKVMDAGLQQENWSTVQSAIRDNHRLLTQIGVVPERAQQFIAQVEGIGGVAKICGAGAVAGDNAGAVLAVTEDKSVLSMLCDRFGYALTPISCESRGIYAV